MTNEEDQKLAELEPRDPPPIAQLIKEMECAVRDSGEILTRMQRSDDVLECFWPGQADDGRKHEADIGEPASPWEGASDARIPLADEIVAEHKLVMMSTLTMGKLNVTPLEASDAPGSALVRPVLAYVLGTLMRQEIWEQCNFWADWSLGYGHSVLHVCWHEEKELEERTVTQDDLLQFAIDLNVSELQAAGVGETVDPQTGQPTLSNRQGQALEIATEDQLRTRLLDEELTEQLIAQLLAFDPAMTSSEARRVVRSLRKGEPATYFAPRVRESRPKWEALQPFVDVFYPVETCDLQRARWISRIHWLSEVELKIRAEQEEWDEKWLEEVLKRPGPTFNLNYTGYSFEWAFGAAGVRRAVSSQTTQEARLFQIVELYYRGTGAAGVPCLYRTILHGSVSDGYALHEACHYKHGKMPFVCLRRERRQRALIASRSIPERAQSFQQALKLQHDARDDRTSLATAPPYTVPQNRAGGRNEIGPFAQIPEKRAGSFKWMDPPKFDGDVVGVVASVTAQVDRYFGRASATVPPTVSMMHNSQIANNFMLALNEAIEQTFQLLQQYMPPIKQARVAGMPLPFSATREEIQGRYDLRLTYDVKDLDMEFLKAKFEFLEKILMMDTEGAVKRTELVSYIFAAVDPVLAQTVMSDPMETSQNEVDDEHRNIVSMAAGFMPAFKMGVNFELRSKVLAEAATGNPSVNRNLQSDKDFAERYKKRWDFFQQQITQKKNAQIGVLGVDPEQAPVPAAGGNGGGGTGVPAGAPVGAGAPGGGY